MSANEDSGQAIHGQQRNNGVKPGKSGVSKSGVTH